jgi:cell division protein FtsZ
MYWMRNGGVAILGNASAEGENRAQKAIEEAMNSPLLNDSDIKGAKWILININSAIGENEFTMDEVEVIQNYLLTQAGDDTDVILGLGYDNTLGNKIGITLIATGFAHKDPFAKDIPKKEEPKKEEKIVMVLGQTENVKPADEKKEMQIKEQQVNISTSTDHMMPKLVEEFPVSMAPVIDITDLKEEISETIHFELQPPVEDVTGQEMGQILSNTTDDNNSKTTVGKLSIAKNEEIINSTTKPTTVPKNNNEEKKSEVTLSSKDSTSTPPVSAASGGYLARPSNIYAESKPGVVTPNTSAEEPVSGNHIASNEEEELLDLQMQMIERDDIPAADMPLAHQAQSPLFPEVEDSALQDETEEQKRRAAERLHKLRNLSFNVNAADPNNEFETVPAYIRRNMELYNNNTHVENFYSSYEVKTDQNNQTQISTINTFLEGKKPD